MSPFPASPQFAFELLKLLLQVAWADDEVTKEEGEALLAYARTNLLSADKVELLAACLAGQAVLPPPNLGYLKEHRTDTMRAVKELLMSDRRVEAEEETILAQIASLLR